MEDLGDTGHTIFEKRNLLKQFATTRNTLASKDIVRYTTDVEDTFQWIFVGGFLCQTRGEFLEVTQLSSPIRGIVHREWKIPMDPPVIFRVHSPKDLLITAHREQTKIRLTPLSLSSGAQHPESTVGHYYIDVPRIFLFGFDVFQIVLTDYVAVVCFLHFSDPREITCVIVDWKTGEMRHERINEKGVTSFCLLDEEHFIFSFICPFVHVPKLSVINICTSARVDFLFPKLATGFSEIIPILSLGSEPLSASSPESTPLPFQISTKDRLIILGFINSHHRFIIPSWALHKELLRVQSATNPTSVTVPWIEWGPHQTAHLFEDVGSSLFGEPSFTSYGTRYISVDEGTQNLVIRDFNRFVVRRDADQGENETPTLYEDDDRDDMPWAMEPVETFLPWREIRTELRVGDRCLIDNDFMLMLEDKFDGEIAAEIVSF
ncbi:hypothetical protein NLI96_g3904 [Meripilus lineatus]|uniref:Uncharacterized protein n=1 Tax=Meripilus lineatus TaxID=2056292 RepID=A0AAD5V5X1_9APHY|nr:hypothetical protein NLI96_g3904 [Physisporinus lineatus]